MTTSSADDLDKRIARIELLMGAPRGSSNWKRYFNDPKVQAEYQELLRERQKRQPWSTPGPG